MPLSKPPRGFRLIRQMRPDINISQRPGDVCYRCPVCSWRVTLTPEADILWTENGQILPRCRTDNVALIRMVLDPNRSHGSS